MAKHIVLPMDEIGAKKIFREEEVRRRFISAVLGIPVSKIRSTRLLNTHLLQRFWNDKEGILDFLKTEDCHTIFHWRDKNGNICSDVQKLHIIEINKVMNENTEIGEWIELFRCKREEELEMLRTRTKNPGIQTALEALKEMSLSHQLKLEWEYHLKQRRDRNAREEFVFDQGVTEGEAKGKAEAILEILGNYGEISEELKEKIQSERDLEMLRKWLSLAVRVDSLEEFEKGMGK